MSNPIERMLIRRKWLAEQGLEEFARYHRRLEADERPRLRRVLLALADAQDELMQLSNVGSEVVTVGMQVVHCDTDDEGTVADAGEALLGPKVLLAAFDAWEKGELFTPVERDVAFGWPIRN